MGVVQFLAEGISWLDRQGGFTQMLVFSLVAGSGTVVLGLAKRSAKFVGSRLKPWLADRAARRPQDSELGFYDHVERLRPLGRTVNQQRITIYGALVKVSALARGYSEQVKDAATVPGVFRKFASAMERQLPKLERSAVEFSECANKARISYLAAFERASPDARAKVFRWLSPEDDAPRLLAKLQQDVDLLTREKAPAMALRGHRYDLTRVCDRYLRTLDTVIAANLDLMEICRNLPSDPPAQQ